LIDIALVAGCVAAASSQAPAAAAPDDGTALISKAQIALRAEDYPRAESLAAQATLGPQAGQAWLILGMARFRQRELEPARAAFALAASLDPASAIAEFDLGSALFELARFADAKTAYLAAAALDPTIAPLATYDAAFAAVKLDDLALGVILLQSAKDLSLKLGRTSLAQKSEEALQAVTQERISEGQARIRELAKRGRDDLRDARTGTAIEDYRAALAEADAIAAPAVDQAELRFGLGYAELRSDQLPASLQDLGEAVRLAPSEAAFHFMLGLAEERSDLSGRAWDDFQQSLALGLSKGDRERADRYLSLLWDRRLEWQKVALEAHAGFGYDSDVPESGVVVTASSSGLTQTSAPYVSADLEAEWRVLGNDRDGLSLEYRFNQLAYLSPPDQLDVYSLQEHALEIEGVWSPRAWLSLSLEVRPFVQFEGIANFGPFQTGLFLGPEITVREGLGFESSLRYAHTFKQSLDPNYAYLSGNRDDLWVRETLRLTVWRLWIGYRFELEQVGVESTSVDSLSFPCPTASVLCPPPSAENYLIPYSYASQEASAGAAVYLPWALRASLDLRYEYRPYQGDSYLQGTGPKGLISYRRPRTDNRYTAEASLRRLFGQHLSVSLQYSVFVNTSDIDNTKPATELDYDDKNYVKQVAEISVGTEW